MIRHLDELPVYRFWVEMADGGDIDLVAGFTECSGLQAEVEMTTYQEGGLNEYAHQLPGRVKFSNVTLRGGIATSVKLWKWFNQVALGFPVRKEISIILYNTNQREMMRWNLHFALPLRWTGPELKADANLIAIQSVEIAYESFTFVPATELGTPPAPPEGT